MVPVCHTCDMLVLRQNKARESILSFQFYYRKQALPPTKSQEIGSSSNMGEGDTGIFPKVGGGEVEHMSAMPEMARVNYWEIWITTKL